MNIKDHQYFKLNNKNIIILGGSKGIGLNISKNLFNLGSNVITISRTKPKNFNSIDYYKCDINNNKAIDEITKKIISKYKKIYAVINCIGVTFPSSGNLQNLNSFKKTIDTNLFQYYAFLLKVYNKIERNGSILNISSIYADLSFPNNPSYSVSKAGINALTRSLANDLEKKNIRVNSISAGYIKSNMTKKSFNDKNKRKIISKHSLLNRWGSLSEIAVPAIFLISNASSFINGQDIVIDGGWTVKGFYK